MVVVTAVQGTTLVVWPVDDIDGIGSPTALPHLPEVASDTDDAPKGADGRTS